MNKELSTRVDRATTEIQWWYETNRMFIPQFNSAGFAHVIAAGTDLAFEIAPAVNAVYVKQSESAYYDFENRAIVLPEFYLTSKGLEMLVGDDLGEASKYVSLTLSNGSLVHEALHCRYTTVTPSDAFVQFVDADDFAFIHDHNLRNVFFYVLNVFEDLAIESFALNPKSGIALAINEIISIKNAFLLPHEQFLSNVKDYKGKFEQLMQLIVGLKNRENRFETIREMLDTQDVYDLRRLCDGSMYPVDDGTGSYGLRVQMAAKFVIRHAEEAERMENKKSGDGEGDGKDGDGEDGEPTSSSGGDDTDPSTSKISKRFASEPEIKAAKQKLSGEALTRLVTALAEKELEHRIARGNDAKNRDIIKLEQNFIERDIMDPSIHLPGYARPELNLKTDLSFVKSLLIARTRNETPGEAKVRGSKIVNTRLTRIVTDGKIFGNPMHVDLPKPLEVIVLIDASGSTQSDVEFEEQRAGLCIFEAEFAKMFFDALKRANIANSIYAHTSLPFSKTSIVAESPILYHIASYNMNGGSSTSLQARFERMRKLPLRENYDGIVYHKMLKKFSRRLTRKLLIVLSDGSPLGPDYRGDEAKRHSKEAVSKLRKNGIDVICLSIGDTHVIKSNNEIFGAANNVDASKSLKREFERIIKQFDK